MIASVSKSSTLIACTDECLSRRVEGKALGFEVEVTTLADVSRVSVPQSSQRISVSASAAPIDLGRRFPQASQKRSEPIATMMEAGLQYRDQFEHEKLELAAILVEKVFCVVLLTKKCSARLALVSLSGLTVFSIRPLQVVSFCARLEFEGLDWP
jgi:hypothetical protein